MVEYEFARRRYSWSKRLNWISVGLCAGLGVTALVIGVFRFLDYQWLEAHFGGGTSTRWTRSVIDYYYTTSILLMVVGALGFVALALGFFKVRKALDEDQVDDIKRWSFLTGLLAALPGAVVGGLLELLIWRAHASESFTIFGLLGSAPQQVEQAPVSPVAVAEAHASEMEARRKAEYQSLFGGASSSSGPGYTQDGLAAAYAADSGYGYGQETGGYDQTPAAAEGYGGQVEAQAPAAAEGDTQYVEQSTGAPICSCGRPMEFVAEYQRYYCYTDDKYEGET